MRRDYHTRTVDGASGFARCYSDYEPELDHYDCRDNGPTWIPSAKEVAAATGASVDEMVVTIWEAAENNDPTEPCPIEGLEGWSVVYDENGENPRLVGPDEEVIVTNDCKRVWELLPYEVQERLIQESGLEPDYYDGPRYT